MSSKQVYAVKEIFYTLQGEGRHAGRPAVFCRFSGCNLWSGSEKKRSQAICNFCDTDFVGTDGEEGGYFKSAVQLAEKIAEIWPNKLLLTHQRVKPFVVFSGGEPLLQLDSILLDAVHDKGFEIAVETNGTLPAPQGIDWICVSPKADAKLVLTKGDELKLVYPQKLAPPEKFSRMNFRHFYLQPRDCQHLSTSSSKNTDQMQDFTRQTIDYCLDHPQWSLSLQTHKIMGIA